MDNSTTARRLREQIAKFSGVVSGGLGKVQARFVCEMLYGIQASESVMLSAVARTLQEPIRVKKTHERLVRQLERRGLGRRLQSNLLEQAARRVGTETLLVLDVSELTKRYARKMQYLCRVRDGTDGEIKPGYWTMNVVATDLEGEQLVPLYQKLYSADAPGFESENIEMLTAIDAVCEHTAGRGIWVIDRSGDRREIIEPMVKAQRRFIIRLRGDRHLVCAGRTSLAVDIAQRCRCPYAETVVKGKGADRKLYHISFGYRRVKLPWSERQLWMLVVKGFGDSPLMLLTTEALRRNRKLLWSLARSYFRRWSIEETIRYIKQCYALENVRVLRYTSLQNLYVLVLLAAHFACAVLGFSAKLQVMSGHLLKAAKRIFDIPQFFYYALADGIKAIFARYPGQPKPLSPPTRAQLTLFPT